ncbi:hypothetical protein MO973_06765 [Paenibacillus sp. TRM 82003]|nr:hypothetical protein [Paenibacillus sp. TRM 82003]
MTKKQRKIGKRVNGFTESLAHLMDLQEDFEAHHDTFRENIDAALTIVDPMRRRQHIARVRYALLGFHTDVVHTAKMALKYYPDRLNQNKGKMVVLLNQLDVLKYRLGELVEIRGKCAHPTYTYSGWEILEKRKRIAWYLTKLVDQLVETLKDGYGLKDTTIDDLVRHKRQRALENDLKETRLGQAIMLENSFRRSQRSWQTTDTRIIPKANGPLWHG